MATINDILQARHINSSTPTNQPVYFVEGPYRFFQDGTVDKLEYMDFGPDIVAMSKFMSPTNTPYNTLVTLDAFKDSATPAEDKEMFKFEWVAMFDQIKFMAADIKDKGGMFVLPNFEYFSERFNKVSSNHTSLTSLRRELSTVIRDCIAQNYNEVERLNANLDNDHKIKYYKRSASFMRRVAEQEKTKANAGKGGKQ